MEYFTCRASVGTAEGKSYWLGIQSYSLGFSDITLSTSQALLAVLTKTQLAWEVSRICGHREINDPCGDISIDTCELSSVLFGYEYSVKDTPSGLKLPFWNDISSSGRFAFNLPTIERFSLKSFLSTKSAY